VGIFLCHALFYLSTSTQGRPRKISRDFGILATRLEACVAETKKTMTYGEWARRGRERPFWQVLVMKALVPAFLVVVAAWANFRFGQNEAKVDDLAAATSSLRDLASDAQQTEATRARELESLKDIVQRLENMLVEQIIRENVKRQTEKQAARFADPGKTGQALLAGLRQDVEKAAVQDLKDQLQWQDQEQIQEQVQREFDELLEDEDFQEQIQEQAERR
jgi:hypothetical protein